MCSQNAEKREKSVGMCFFPTLKKRLSAVTKIEHLISVGNTLQNTRLHIYNT